MPTNRPTTAAAVAAFSLLFAIGACGDDDDDDAAEEQAPATTEAPTATTQPPVTTAEAVTTAPTEPVPSTDSVPTDDGPHPDCMYDDNLVIVKGDGSDSLETPDVLTLLTPATLADALGYSSVPEGAEYDPLEFQEIVTDILGDLLTSEFSVYQILTGDDPRQVATEIGGGQALRGTPQGAMQAAPVLLTMMTGHWSAAPGEDAEPSEQPSGVDTEVPEGASEPEQIVAVVDTGYSDSDGSQSWLDFRADPVDAAFDKELPTLGERVRGHGKFVASIIAQEAPDVGVRVARLVDNGSQWYGVTPPTVATGYATDEFQLYIAVHRLIDSADDRGYSALNLSLGAYACPGEGEDVAINNGFAIQEAVNLWDATYDVPIIAAAGNHTPGTPAPAEPFVPAAFGSSLGAVIVPVASVDPAGNDSDFSNPAPIAAMGEGLIGLRADQEWAAWGGTSFATALYSAATVRDGTVPATPYNPPVNVTFTTSTTPPTTTTIASNVTTTTRAPEATTTTRVQTATTSTTPSP